MKLALPTTPLASETSIWKRAPGIVLLGVYVLANIYPFLWMISTSFKSKAESFTNSGLIPGHLTTSAYSQAWSAMDAIHAFFNSVIYSGASVLAVLAVYPMAGFVFAKVQFRGRDFLFKLLVAVLVVPGITLLVPIVLLDQKVGLLNTWPGLLLPTIAGAGPIPLYLMRNYFRLLPHELVEAGRLDGASYFKTYLRVFLPLSVPALTTVAILTLVYVWNSYILPNVILSNPNMFPLPLALFGINATGVPGPDELMAGALMVIIPLMAAFVSLQRYYVAGLTAGAVKT